MQEYLLSSKTATYEGHLITNEWLLIINFIYLSLVTWYMLAMGAIIRHGILFQKMVPYLGDRVLDYGCGNGAIPR